MLPKAARTEIPSLPNPIHKLLVAGEAGIRRSHMRGHRGQEVPRSVEPFAKQQPRAAKPAVPQATESSAPLPLRRNSRFNKWHGRKDTAVGDGRGLSDCYHQGGE
jgi:hypothetical protein